MLSFGSVVGLAKDKTAKEIRREERRRQKAVEKEEKRRLKKLAKAREKVKRINDENVASVGSATGTCGIDGFCSWSWCFVSP